MELDRPAQWPRLAGRALVALYRYTLSPVIGPRCRHLADVLGLCRPGDRPLRTLGRFMDGARSLSALPPVGHRRARFRAGYIAGRRALVPALALRTLAGNQRTSALTSENGWEHDPGCLWCRTKGLAMSEPALTMDRKTWLLLVLLSVLWGGSFFFIGAALRELPPLTVVLARVPLAPPLCCRSSRSWAARCRRRLPAGGRFSS